MVGCRMGFIPIVLASMIAGGVLLAGGGTYTGVAYYQSNKLVKEADELVLEGKYADAITKYDKAKRKWPWAKIGTKKTESEELNQLQAYNIEGSKYFGEGEWQKCLEYLGKVTSKFPNYGEVQARYSDCEKKLAEKQAAEAADKANASPAPATAKKTSPSSTANNSASSGDGSTSSPVAEVANPVLYLPYSIGSNLPDMMTPMGETLYHPKPQNPDGHPGIDFQWGAPSQVPTITASMDATITAITDDPGHPGTYDVMTKSGNWGVDYCELGSVREGLKVGDAIKVGDTIGAPQHPTAITDQPNFRMIHWQFGTLQDERYGTGVGTRLCPLLYFSLSARSSIESLWANTNAPELKANAPDICSGDYK